MLRIIVMSWLLSASVMAQEPGTFTRIFDGKSLDGWQRVGGQEGNWLVEDGLLVTRGAGGGWLSTEGTYADFELSLEYRLQEGGNSGVFIRSPREGDPAYTGMEIQILDDEDKRYESIKPFQHCGSVYGVIPAQPGHTLPAGSWNRMEIRIIGTKIQITLNGTRVVDGDIAAHSEAVATHPGLKRADGYIGLQSHSEPVVFRNIRIRPL